MNMKPIKVFIDSSVTIAGLVSKRGGAYEILILTELGIIIPYISEQVVYEVIRNVEKKIPECIEPFYLLFKTLPFNLVVPTATELKKAELLIDPKDVPILAAAMIAGVDWLLSLDKHFLQLRRAEQIEFNIGTPGDLLQRL